MNWSIYTLKDPRSMEIRYVGVTVDPEERLRTHIASAAPPIKPPKRPRPTTHKDHWIRLLIRLGLKPVLEVFYNGFGEAWDDCERYWIKYFKEIGCNLTNATSGGEGVFGMIHSEEAKRKMSIAKTGKPLPRTKYHMDRLGEGRLKRRPGATPRVSKSGNDSLFWAYIHRDYKKTTIGGFRDLELARLVADSVALFCNPEEKYLNFPESMTVPLSIEYAKKIFKRKRASYKKALAA